MANSNKKAKINPANIELIEFAIETKMFLADNIQKIHLKWAINNFTKYNNINLIILLIMNIRTEFANHIEKLLIICSCQVAKYNCFDIDNINNISEDIISLW